MFSGIIRHTGVIKKITRKGGMEMTISAPQSLRKFLRVGSSLNTNGVCLTVTSVHADKIKVFLMNETLRLTSFADARVGDIVNLESSLRLGDEISGHFVFGHVDAVGKIARLTQDGSSTIMTIAVPKKIMRYAAVKGSISINGISLTIIAGPKNSISVALIPHTLKVTNLKNKKVGDLVNIEVDMLARYALGAQKPLK